MFISSLKIHMSIISNINDSNFSSPDGKGWEYQRPKKTKAKEKVEPKAQEVIYKIVCESSKPTSSKSTPSKSTPSKSFKDTLAEVTTTEVDKLVKEILHILDDVSEVSHPFHDKLNINGHTISLAKLYENAFFKQSVIHKLELASVRVNLDIKIVEVLDNSYIREYTVQLHPCSYQNIVKDIVEKCRSVLKNSKFVYKCLPCKDVPCKQLSDLYKSSFFHKKLLAAFELETDRRIILNLDTETNLDDEEPQVVLIVKVKPPFTASKEVAIEKARSDFYLTLLPPKTKSKKKNVRPTLTLESIASGIEYILDWKGIYYVDLTNNEINQDGWDFSKRQFVHDPIFLNDLKDLYSSNVGHRVNIWYDFKTIDEQIFLRLHINKA